MESFVDPGKFSGTCYQARGLDRVGKDHGPWAWREPIRAYQSTPKMIYVKALAEDVRERLCSRPFAQEGGTMSKPSRRPNREAIKAQRKDAQAGAASNCVSVRRPRA